MSSTSCSDNVVTMSWVSNEAVSSELYTVQAFSADGLFSDSCSGFGQSCDLTSLMCGVPYTATVIAQDSVCTSAPSQAASIRTGKCDFIAICIRNTDEPHGAEISTIQSLITANLKLSCS